MTDARPGKSLIAAAIVAVFSAAAGAQQAAAPTDAKASVPPVAHQSPFSGYRVHADAKPAPWREVNDEVARIGGWKAYAREAYEAAQAAEKSAPATQPAMGPHGAKPAK